jgi:peptide/nickel transport system substrate-binding protein
MRSRAILGALCALAIVAALAGCGGKAGAGKDTVTLVIGADIATLDPIKSASLVDSQVFCNIYDPLFRTAKDGSFAPRLAESWSASPDGTSYTFKIRKGVKFHDGSTLKTSDVVFSFNAARKSPYLEGQFSVIANVEAVDDSTVRVDLAYAFAPFLGSLNDSLYIMSEAAVTKAGDSYGEQPVGTGPYKFVKHETGVSVSLERNDGYWGTKAPIKNAVFKVITDQNTALIALKTGEVDFIYEVPAISKADIAANSKLALYETPTIRIAYVIMNTSAKPFSDVTLRRAVNYAVDKAKAITVATEGMAVEAKGIFSKDIFGYSEIAGYSHDPAKAKELLAQAGYPKGLSVTLKTTAGPLAKVAQSIQEDLAKIGITASIDQGERNAFFGSLARGNYEMGSISVSCGNDADYYNVILQTGAQGNFSHYSNPKVDALFKAGREATDTAKRLEIYKELAQFLSDDAVIVPLYYPVNLSAAKAELGVGYIDPILILAVSEMSWKK